MKTLSEYLSEKLKFSQPSIFKRYYELKADDELLGTMQQRGFFGMRWEINIQDKNFEFIKPSCWKSIIEIREAGFEMPFASYQRDSWKNRGSLSLPKGDILKIIPRFFKGFCEITTESGEQLVKIKSKISFGDKAEVVIEKKSDIIDKYPWTIMLAYTIALEQRHRTSHSM